MKCIDESYKIFEIPNISTQSELFKYLQNIGELCCKQLPEMNIYHYIKYLANPDSNSRINILDHIIVAFEVSKEIYDDIIDHKSIDNPKNYQLQFYVKQIITTEWVKDDKTIRYIISAPISVFTNVWKDNIFGYNNSNGFIKLCHWIAIAYPELVTNYHNHHIISNPGIKFITNSEMQQMPKEIRMAHGYITIRLTMNCSDINQISRNRSLLTSLSTAEEYDISNDPCSFIIPSEFDESNDATVIRTYPIEDILSTIDENPFGLQKATIKWLKLCKKASALYNYYVNSCNHNANRARTIMPHSASSSIIITMRNAQWISFFNKYINDSYPDIRDISKEILKDFNKVKPELFCDCMNLIKED